MKGKPGSKLSLHTAWRLSSLSLPTKQGDIGGEGNVFCLQCRINMTKNQTVNPLSCKEAWEIVSQPPSSWNSWTLKIAPSLSKAKYGLKHKYLNAWIIFYQKFTAFLLFSKLSFSFPFLKTVEPSCYNLWDQARDRDMGESLTRRNLGPRKKTVSTKARVGWSEIAEEDG